MRAVTKRRAGLDMVMVVERVVVLGGPPCLLFRFMFVVWVETCK